MEEEEVDEYGIPIKKLDEFGVPIRQVDEYGIPIKKAEVVGDVIGAVSPAAKGVYDFGRTVYSGLTDVVPQTIAQANEVRKSSMYSQTLRDYIKNNQSVEFQKYVREKEPEYQGFSGFFTPFKGVDTYVDRYGKEFLESKGLGEKIDTFEEKLPEVTKRRKELETYVKTQKEEAAQKTGGVVQDFRDIGSVSDFASYIGGLAGQAAYQIPLSVGTRGLSSYVMEAATVYDQQLDNLATVNNISREEVIERNLDDPAAGQAYAVLAGALDAASAGEVIGAFRKSGGSLLKKFLVQQTEGVTEATQGVLEDLGAGGKLAENLTKEGIAKRANEYFGGVVGGSFNFFGKGDQKKLADKAINEANTGDAQINGIIDAEGTLTPQEEEVLKTKRAEENLDEVKAQEEKLKNDKENKQGIPSKVENRQESKQGDTDQETSSQTTETGGVLQEEVSAENTATNAAKEAENFNETPEYIAADDKIKDIADKIRQNPSDEALFTQLNEAKQERDNARIAFEKKKPRVKKNKSVQLTPNEAVIAQIKIQDRGIKIGRDLTQEQVISKIKEAAKEANLTPKQVSSLASRAEKVSLTPKSLEKYNEYVQKVIADADYADKVTRANELRSKIKKKIKNGTPPEKQTFGAFLQLNPESTDINEYIRVAEEASNGFRPVTDKGYRPIQLKPVAEFTDKQVGAIFSKEFPDNKETTTTAEQLGMLNEKRVAERAILQNERLRAKLEKNYSPDQINAFIEALSNESDLDDEIRDLNKKEQVRQVFKQLAQDRQDNLPEGNDDVLKSMKGANLSELSANQLKLFIKFADKITENEDFGGSGIILPILRAQEDFKKLKDFNILGVSDWEQELSASLPAVFRAVTGLPTDAAKFQLYLGIKGLSDVAVKSVDASEDFVHKMNEMHEKFSKLYGKNNNGFTSDSIFRQGIVSELIKSDPNNDNALEMNKEAVQATINTHKEAKEDNEARAFDRLYKPFKDAKSIDEVLQIMQRVDPAGKKVLDFIINYFKPYGTRVEESNLKYHNKPTQLLENYAGESIWKTVLNKKEEAVDQSDIADIDSPGYYARVSKPKQDRSQLEFKRRIPPGKVLDFNLHHKVNRQIQRLYLKTEGLPYMLQVREMAKQKDRMKAILGDKVYDAVFHPEHGAYFKYENNLLNKAPIPTNFDRTTRSILNTLRKFGYTIRLGGVTQWIKQPMVLINTSIQAGVENTRAALNEIWNDKAGYAKFIEGETVSKRGHQKSLWNIGDSYISSLNSGLRNQINKHIQGDLSKYVDTVFENSITGIGALLRADNFAANPSYLAFYRSHLQKLGQKYQGFEQETKLKDTPERREARAVAKQMLDDLQVPSNAAELVANIQHNRDYKSTIARNILFPFGGFNNNMKQRLVSDWRAAFTGNEKQRSYAVKDMSAAIAESAMFNLANQFVLGFLFHLVGEGWEMLLGLPDEDDEDKYKKWWQRTWTGMILDNIPLILTNPGEEAMTDGLNWVGYELYNLNNEAGLTYEQYAKEVGAPFQKYHKPSESTVEMVANALGPIGTPVQVMIQNVQSLQEINDNLSDEQKRLAFIVSMMQFANSVGFWPSDMTSATRREYFEQKKMNKATGGGGTPTTDVTTKPNLPEVPNLPELPDLPELN